MKADDDEFDWVMAMIEMDWFDSDDKQLRGNSQSNVDSNDVNK